MVKAIGGLSLMPSDTGAMPQKIHPNSCIEGKPENPGNPEVSRPSQAIFHPLSWEKSRFVEPGEFDREERRRRRGQWSRGRPDDPPAGGAGLSGGIDQVPGLRAKRRQDGDLSGRNLSD